MKFCCLIVGFLIEIGIVRYLSHGFMTWSVWTQALFMLIVTYATAMVIGLYLLSVDREVDSVWVKAIPIIGLFLLGTPFFVILQNQPIARIEGFAVCVALGVLAGGFWMSVRIGQACGLFTKVAAKFIGAKWQMPTFPMGFGN